MDAKESNLLIDFHHLAIELRRLRKNSYAISTAALLINQSITKPIEYSALLQTPESQKLSGLCQIICYRFSNDPSSDILRLISMLRFTRGPQQIGPWFLLNNLLSIYHDRLTEECYKCLSYFDPIFFEKYLLGRVYLNPQSLFRSTTNEIFLPLQVPNLSNLAYKECNNSSLIKYLLHYSLSRSSQHIIECSQNENLFDSFANFVYKCPEFFIISNQLFDNKNLHDIFLSLKNKDPSKFLSSYLITYNQTSHETMDLILNLYSDQDLLKYVSDDRIEDLFNFLQINDRWDIITQLFERNEKAHSILTGFFQNSFLRDARKYLSKYSQLKLDFLIDAIESFLLGTENHIEPKHYVYLLPNDKISLIMLERDRHFLQIVMEASMRKDEVNEKTVKLIVSFINRNLKRILSMFNDDFHRLLFDEESIVFSLIRLNELLFFDIFDGQENIQILTLATINLISFIVQTMAQEMAQNGRPPSAQARPTAYHLTLRFPSIAFFKKMAKKVDLQTAMIEIYRANQGIVRLPEWREALVAVPELLFTTLGFSLQFPEFGSDHEYFDVFQRYITVNYNNFSKSLDAFLVLVNFFLDTQLLSAIPGFKFNNLCLSVQLSVLDSFASCCHLVFMTDDDQKTLKKFISLFKIIEETDVLKLASPSNSVICHDFVLPLLEMEEFEKDATKMMIHLNTSLHQPIGSEKSTFSKDAEAPKIEDLDVDVSTEIDDESLHFIIDFLLHLMPEEAVIAELAKNDPVSLRKIVELSLNVLSHHDCPLWNDPRFMRSLYLIINSLDYGRLNPGFLQSLAFHMSRYTGNGTTPVGAANSQQHDEFHPELFDIYQILASLAVGSHDFADVLDVLL